MRAVAGVLAAVKTPLFRQTTVYTLSNLLSRVAPFLLLPVLTRYLSPADYGLVAMFLLVTVLLEPFVNLGLPGAISVQYYDSNIDMRRLFATGLALALVAAMVAAIVMLLAGPGLEVVTQVPASWLLVAIPVVLGRTVFASLMSLLRVQERPIVFGLFQNVQTLAVVGLAVLLVAALGRGWPGRLEAEFLATSAMAIVAIAWLVRRRLIHRAPNRAYAGRLLRFGVPLIPHAIGAVLIVQTDRLFLTNMVGLDQTGLYTVGYQLALVIEVAAISFNNAYAPWLYKRLASREAGTARALVRVTYAQFAVMTVLAAAVALGMPFIAGAVLDPRYGAASTFVGWLALGFLFSAMYYMVANYIFFAHKTEWLAAVTLTAALINIPVTYLLISVNGAVGAAQATAIALGLSFLLTWVVSQRVYPMPWLAALRGESARGPVD